MNKQYFEYRGVDNLVYAKVIADTKDNYVTGPVKKLSPVAKIKRSTANSSKTNYYDNQPFSVISSVGTDTLELTVAAFDLETYAEITNQTFDAAHGALIEGDRNQDYFAIGYRTKGTDGKYRFVWRYKGQFSIPDEESITEDDGTDTTNVQLTWTGIATIHKFASTGKVARSMTADERYVRIDEEAFFSKVQLPGLADVGNTNRVTPPVIYPLESIVKKGSSIMVSIVHETPGIEILYTTDGTEPAKGSETTQVYSAPFEISSDTTIKTVAYHDRVQQSETVTRLYLFE